MINDVLQDRQRWHIECGDALTVLRIMPDQCVQLAVTSPPYWNLRDYGHDGQIGVEPHYQNYVIALVEIFKEVWRVLRDDGTVFLNLGDTYTKDGKPGGNQPKSSDNWAVDYPARDSCGIRKKSLVGIPWRIALALMDDGWILRNDIIWHKLNPMPMSASDRFTNAHEYIFFFSKSERYYHDQEAVKEECATQENRPHGIIRDREYGYDSKLKITPRPNHKNLQRNNSHSFQMERVRPKQDQLGKNTYTGFNFRCQHPEKRIKRDVWSIATSPYKDAHFAVFPPALVEPCIKSGSPKNGIILDPFAGAGTTLLVSQQLGRRSIGIELNTEYVEMANKRISDYDDKFALLEES